MNAPADSLTEVMTATDMEATINAAWNARETIGIHTDGPARIAVTQAMKMLDRGQLRVAEPAAGRWHVNEWLKKAILLYFRLHRMERITGAPGDTLWWDKVPLKCAGWTPETFRAAGFRAVPGSIWVVGPMSSQVPIMLRTPGDAPRRGAGAARPPHPRRASPRGRPA